MPLINKIKQGSRHIRSVDRGELHDLQRDESLRSLDRRFRTKEFLRLQWFRHTVVCDSM
jgi:hypothetical protein